VSWHYSAEQEEDFSLQDYLAGLPLGPARLSSTRETSSCSDRETDCSTSSQSGTTSAPSTDTPGEDTATSSQEASLARMSVRQVKVQELPEAVAACGVSTRESLARLGLDLCSRKTLRCCVPVALAWLSKTLPAWGMTYDGECWEHGTSVRITEGTECGCLPTPTANQYGSTNNGKRGDGSTYKTAGTPSLTSMATSGELTMWPTPKASAAGPDFAKTTRSKTGIRLQTAVALEEKKWPTPTVSDYKGSGPTMVRKDGKRRGDRLDYATERNRDGTPVLPGGALNPTWVEWLMAWPSEWTDLKPLAMDRFQQWLQLLSEFCLKDGSDEQHAVDSQTSPKGAEA